MKIIHVCLAGPFTEGHSYQENLLSKYHSRLGHEVYVIAGKEKYNNEGEIIFAHSGNYQLEDNITLIRLPYKDNIMFAWDKKIKRYQGLYYYLETIAPDLIFVHGVQFLDSYTITNYISKERSTKLLVDNHADFSNSATNIISKFFLHKILWRSCAKQLDLYANHFFGVMPSRVKFLTDMYGIPSNKISLLKMGADDDLVNKYNDAPKDTKNNYSQHLKTIITGGKIDSSKLETLDLMRAVNQLKDKTVKLYIFGSVDKSIKKQFESELSDRVIYLGWLDQEAIYSKIGKADLAIFPGRHSVLWEQVVALGCPLIVKKWDGIEHLDIGGNVIFMDDTNTNNILHQINKLVENNELFLKLAKAARSESRETFLYSRIARYSLSFVE